MSVENGKKEPINPQEALEKIGESIDEPGYVYKRAEGVLPVTPEDEEIYAKALAKVLIDQHDRTDGLVIRGCIEKYWRNAYENLPEIPKGYVRLLHHTYTAELAEEIRQTGLKYNLSVNRNHIESTACVVRDMNEKNENGNRVLDNTRVESQEEGAVVVFDLSEEDYQKYGYNNGAPGVIPAEFFVAALPERKPIIWIDKEKGIFVTLSERFSQKP